MATCDILAPFGLGSSRVLKTLESESALIAKPYISGICVEPLRVPLERQSNQLLNANTVLFLNSKETNDRC